MLPTLNKCRSSVVVLSGQDIGRRVIGSRTFANHFVDYLIDGSLFCVLVKGYGLSVFWIYLDEPAGEELEFQLFSITGQVAGRYILEKGSRNYRVPAGLLEPGVYLLSWTGSGRSLRVVINP